MVLTLGIMIIFIGPRFEAKELFFAGEVLTGESNQATIRILIYDGVPVFFVERIDAF